jgi:hypothetical protein
VALPFKSVLEKQRKYFLMGPASVEQKTISDRKEIRRDLGNEVVMG